MLAAFAMAAAAILGGCAQDPEGGEGAGDLGQETSEAPPVRFLAFGDMGTGDEAQATVAAGMLEVCAAAGCDFVIGLGDNIYEAGVASAYDPQFVLKFETPYQGFDIPFYMSLGNHDNGGVRSLHAIGDFQVAYATRTDRAMDLWVMPARWYEHVHGPVRFLALDTNVVFSSQSEVPGAAAALTKDVDGVQQLAWLRERLADPDGATWTFLHGHHPLYSNGEHGNAGVESPSLEAWLRQVVCETEGVDVLVSGHDHDLQYLPAQEGCGDVEFIVSGAPAQVRDIPGGPNPTLYSCGSTLGFAWMEVRGEVLTTRFHAADGTLLAERVLDREDPSASSFVEHTRPATCTPS
jgi:tartrate-resistant acid phosphatase type 5